MNKFSKELNVALSAALKAGERIMQIYNSKNLQIEKKNDSSPLTIADKESNNIIIEILKKTQIPILSEEEKYISYETRKNWDLLWIIDPIDGTKEFINKNGEFTVNIALIKKNKPILGVVYLPYTNTVYYAEEKLGSFKSTDVKSVDEISNSNTFDLKKSKSPLIFTVVSSKSHLNKETNNYIKKITSNYKNYKVVSYGSSLKICKVAEGSASCYPRFGPTMEWDTAAAQAVAEIAGKIFINVNNNKSLTYNKKELKNPNFLVKFKK